MEYWLVALCESRAREASRGETTWVSSHAREKKAQRDYIDAHYTLSLSLLTFGAVILKDVNVTRTSRRKSPHTCTPRTNLTSRLKVSVMKNERDK